MARKPKAKRQVMGRDKWRKKKEEQDAKRQGSNCIILPKGVEFLKRTKKGVGHYELLPYEVTDPNHPAADVGDLYYCRPFKRHSNVGQNDSQVICPSTWGKSCPICKEQAKRKADGDEDDAKKLKASNRGLYVFIDKDNDDAIVVFQAGFWAKGGTHGFGMMLEDEIGYQDESDSLPWDWDGPSLKIRFGEDTYKKSKFYPVEKLDLRDDGKDVDPDIMDDVPNLDDCLVRLSYEEIEKMSFGIDDDDDDPDDDDKVAKREAKAKSKAKTAKPKPKKEEPKKEEKEEDPDDVDYEEIIRDWDPDEVDFDDHDDADDARNTLLEAADYLKLDTSGIKKTLTGPNNDTERGMKKLQNALIELLDEVPEPEPEPVKEEKTKAKSKSKVKAKKEKNACPHDHTYGKDWEDFTECEDCDVEDACSKAE